MWQGQHCGGLKKPGPMSESTFRMSDGEGAGTIRTYPASDLAEGTHTRETRARLKSEV